MNNHYFFDKRYLFFDSKPSFLKYKRESWTFCSDELTAMISDRVIVFEPQSLKKVLIKKNLLEKDYDQLQNDNIIFEKRTPINFELLNAFGSLNKKDTIEFGVLEETKNFQVVKKKYFIPDLYPVFLSYSKTPVAHDDL